MKVMVFKRYEEAKAIYVEWAWREILFNGSQPSAMTIKITWIKTNICSPGISLSFKVGTLITDKYLSLP